MILPQLALLLLLLLQLSAENSAAAEAAAAASAPGSGTPIYPVLCDPRSQGCLHHPPGCRSVHRSEPDLGCSYLATWRFVQVGPTSTTQHHEAGIEIAIAGRVGVNGGYVGFGFKPSRGGGDTRTVLLTCYKATSTAASEPDGDAVRLRLATYSRAEGMRFLSAASDAALIGEARGAPQFEPSSFEQAGYFRPVAAAAAGGAAGAAGAASPDEQPRYGIVECRARLRLGRSGGGPLEHLLQHPEAAWLRPLAVLHDGKHRWVTPAGDGLEQPTWRRAASARPVGDVGEAESRSTGAAKAHGCIMVLAWVLCASVGSLLARYYKMQWPSRMLCGELAWFQVHRALMASCCVLTLLGFIIIFADVSGYSGLDELPDLVHPILGIVVTALALTNPLISLCRCKPGHAHRPWFNWIHWLVATIAYILAIINLFLGLRLERAGNLRSIHYHVWILILFVLLQFVVEIVLEIHTLYHWRRNKRRWAEYHQAVLDYQQRLREAAGEKPQSRPTEPQPAGSGLRLFLLALHAIVACAVALILIVVIIVY